MNLCKVRFRILIEARTEQRQRASSVQTYEEDGEGAATLTFARVRTGRPPHILPLRSHVR